MSNNKMALISDIHFGIKGNSETFLDVIEKFFLETLRDTLDIHKVKDVRILGDLFDHRNNVNVRTFNAVLDIFSWYEDNRPDIHFTILLGNHDIYFKNRVDVNSVRMLSKFENVTLISEITEETINGKKIITYPWLVKESSNESTFKSNCQGKKQWDLCLGHFEIQGFEMVRGAPDVTGVEQGQFKNFGRVFTGHYHIRNTNNQISYLGCPYEINWNDYDDQKGIHIYDLDTGETDFIPNTDSPKHIKVKAEEILSANAKTLKKLAHNTVKLVIDEKIKDDDINKIYDKLGTLSLVDLETENNVVAADAEAEEVDISNLNNPLVFLIEYTNNLTLDDEYDTEVIKTRLNSIFQTVEESK